MRKLIQTGGASLLAMAMFQAGAAHAQEAGTQEGGISEIVVTAEKREVSVQKTAIAISAFDSKKLEENGVTTLQDLAAIAPGVSISKNSANAQPSPHF
jgi:iron complex outermembrane receptor protein